MHPGVVLVALSTALEWCVDRNFGGATTGRAARGRLRSGGVDCVREFAGESGPVSRRCRPFERFRAGILVVCVGRSGSVLRAEADLADGRFRGASLGVQAVPW